MVKIKKCTQFIGNKILFWKDVERGKGKAPRREKSIKNKK